jgi:hypothetical protein
LGTIQRLHLALLVVAQRQRVLGWVEVDPTMSSSFSATWGLRESLNVSTKSGLSLL